MKPMIKTQELLCIVFVLSILSATILPVVTADSNVSITSKGFDKGPSYTNVLPMKKVTLVNFDETSYLDDYAYLASVPTAVFKDQDQLYSHPLLFYQDEYRYDDDIKRSFNARQGLDYFMEDWMQYSNGQLDQMVLINGDENKIPNEWTAKEITTIKSSTIYDLAKEIALNDFSYSNDAVVAVAEETFKKPEYEFNSEIRGSIEGSKAIKETFHSPQADKLNPRFHEFNVPEGYKYIKARTWWASITGGIGKNSDLPLSILITIPIADPDTQFYCNYNDDEWLQASYTQAWNLNEGMDEERTQMYAYSSGKWRLSVTDVPTFERHGSFLDILRNMFKGSTYQTDITIFPGTEIEIPEKPPIGCRDATFTLTWDNPTIDLGMAIIGPAGEEILAGAETEVNEQQLHLDRLGECPEGKKYSVAVFKLDESDNSVNFKVEYSWSANFTQKEADSLTSATQGAVLASQLNAPLLYTKTSEIPTETEEVLYQLGVKNIHLIDLNGHLKKNALDQLNSIANVRSHYKEHNDIYQAITTLSGQNDIIITTIDPWTKWLVTDLKPYEQTDSALFIGPSAYIAAHHGSPVLITDSHPELSSAAVWHTEFWRRNGGGQPEPPGAPMSLTGRQAYDYFDEIGLDKPGMETMITIAGQYNIGAPWDRTFVGRAMPGRFFGSPVDTAYWISRNIFYPALIFNNPGAHRLGQQYIQGSHSERRTLLPFGPVGLKVTREEKVEQVAYPILHSYIAYNHNLNDVFEKYYGFRYECRDNIIPGVSASSYAIDEGIVPGKIGAVWPDFSATISNPIYSDRGGFGNVYSTGYSAIVDNLNQGVLLWNFGAHGGAFGSGILQTWPEEGLESVLGMNVPVNLFGYEKESNPWRGYDFLMGSTDNPDTMTMNAHGIIPGILGNPNIDGLFPLGWDYTVNEKPYRQTLFRLFSYIPILGSFVDNRPWLMDSSYFKDGLVSAKLGSFVQPADRLTGYNMDEDLENLHSTGWILSSCLPAYKYLHLTMVRHGSSFQVMDPWPTSWYVYWTTTMIRDMILGDTVGRAYTKGISHVGALYANDPTEWWWDVGQNVVYYGDPDLRMLVPGKDYGDTNHWTTEEVASIRCDSELNVNGHMPFGAETYPNASERQLLLFGMPLYFIALVLIILLVIFIGFMVIKRKDGKDS